MVHTGPDYSEVYKQAKVYGNIDNAEVAARLGSIDTFDRRGNLVWMDDFEKGAAKWNLAGNGLGNTQAISATRARNGQSSMLLTCGSNGLLNAQMGKYMPLPALKTIGVEMSFSLGANVSRFSFNVWLYYNNRLYKAQLAFHVADEEIYYMNSAGANVLLDASHTFRETSSYWTTVKLVVDWSTGRYIRAIINDATYDLSAQLMNNTALVSDRYLYVLIDGYSVAASNGTIFVDDVIITQNE